MKSPAWHRGIRKGLRTVVQLVAGGALTALVTAVAGGLSPQTAAVVLGAWTVLVSVAQNVAETAGKIPTLLPTPGLVPSAGRVAGKTVGVVETTVEQVGEAVGEVTGVVQDTAGELLGEVGGVDHEDEAGGIPLAFVILAVVVFVVLAGLMATCDALFEDEDETNDLGLPALVLNHDDRDRYYEEDGWGGGSDGNSGGRYEGGGSGDMEQGDGRNCRNFCDNVIYIPDPRGGEEPR